MYSFRIEQAVKAATILHQGQVRKGSVPVPYVSHLISVMVILHDYTSDEDVLIAALLHDTIEDTDYTPEELSADFGATVHEIVMTVTEPAQHPDDWQARKKAYARQLERGPEAALLVAAADKIHNMRSIVEEYYEQPEVFVNTFGGTLDDRLQQYQGIANILNKRLGNEILAEFNHVFSEYKDFIQYVKNQTENT